MKPILSALLAAVAVLVAFAVVAVGKGFANGSRLGVQYGVDVFSVALIPLRHAIPWIAAGICAVLTYIVKR
jgi:hypothetical protein